MRAGLLRNRVTFETLTTARDAFGAETETWGTLATEWARVEPMQGSELFESDNQFTERPTKFWVRYRSGLALDEKTTRISYGGDTYDIESIADVMGRQRMYEVVGVRRG